MIGIYERSLCQSYASAYRAGIKIGEAETREDALKQVEAMTEDSYQCFAVDDDGTCIDLTGTFPTLTADWHNPAVYPIDEPITMADLNANTAIGYDMVGTLKVGGDAPSVCL